MPRLFPAILYALVLLASACHKNPTDQPEPAGSLEGTWRVGLTDPVEYDAQNNVLATYQPQANIMDYTQLKFTGTHLEQYHEQANISSLTPYVRMGDQLTCPAPAGSYTIRKLTTRHLDL